MSKKLIQAAAGAGGESVYVEDVFSTYLYDGNSSTQTITNGIDLSGEGGLVWIKSRSQGATYYDNVFCDTERGPTKYLASSGVLAASGEQTQTASPRDITSFNSDGFSLAADNTFYKNVSGETFTSWSFRKQAGFFDVVTWNGDGTGAKAISHSLNSTPACIIIKKTTSDTTWHNWYVYHKDSGTTPNDNALFLNTNDAVASPNSFLNYTDPTSTNFTVTSGLNASGHSYVAYLFAHDDQSFGDNSDESIIKCGTFTTSATATATVTLGWEPQWVMVKRTDSTSSWYMVDMMRGAPQTNANYLSANLSDAEAAVGSYKFATPTSTGFDFGGGLAANADYIYIAIRRPMKTPEAGTEVFAPALGDATAPDFESGFPVDFAITGERAGSDKFYVTSRLTGGNYMNSTSIGNEASATSIFTWDYMDGVFSNSLGSTYVSWLFKRARGFMDVVAYDGSSTLFQTYNHNLGVTPELVIVKCRTATSEASHNADWFVLSKGPAASGSGSGYRFNGGLNLADAASADDAWGGMTDTTFTPFYATAKSGPGGIVGQINGEKYIAYLFASLDGISKIGAFTHTNGSDTNVDCGFSSGARFVLIKRTDASDGWQVYDTVRGIVAGSDPVLQLNSTAAEFNQDLMDPYSSGFTITGTKTSGTYIFLAIA